MNLNETLAVLRANSVSKARFSTDGELLEVEFSLTPSIVSEDRVSNLDAEKAVTEAQLANEILHPGQVRFR